jgi:hypothetical protein
VGDGARTRDFQIHSLTLPEPNPLQDNTSGASPSSVARQLPTEAEIDPDLARIIDAWPTLPAQLRAAVMALVGTAR